MTAETTEVKTPGNAFPTRRYGLRSRRPCEDPDACNPLETVVGEQACERCLKRLRSQVSQRALQITRTEGM